MVAGPGTRSPGPSHLGSVGSGVGRVGPEEHAAVLEWHRALIALRRSSTDLSSGDRHAIEAEADDAAGWLRIRRGQTWIVANVGAAEASVPLDRTGDWRVLLASDPQTVALEHDSSASASDRRAWRCSRHAERAAISAALLGVIRSSARPRTVPVRRRSGQLALALLVGATLDHLFFVLRHGRVGRVAVGGRRFLGGRPAAAIGGLLRFACFFFSGGPAGGCVFRHARQSYPDSATETPCYRCQPRSRAHSSVG